MTWLNRDLRIVPVALLAVVALFALKVVGLVSEGSYILSTSPTTNTVDLAKTAHAPDTVAAAGVETNTRQLAQTKSWAQDVLNSPDYTGSIAAKPAEKPAPSAKPGAPAPASTPDPGAIQIPADGTRPLSASERAVLERLGDRRQELEQRARELDIRENLLKAAEKRIEARVNELKEIEARVNTAMQKRDEEETARFKGLVTMYEGMKPKEAAKIFDRLEMKVLFEVASQINPRRMSEILASMSPEAAQKLTIELANRANGTPLDKSRPVAELPKIEGRPNP